MNIENSNISIQNSARGRDYGELQIGEFLHQGNTQQTYRLLGNYRDKVIKIINLEKTSGKILRACARRSSSFTTSCYSILHAVEKSGVPMPSYWDVIEGESYGVSHSGFIQTYYPNLKEGTGGLLPNVGQGNFESDKSHERSELYGDFLITESGEEIFLDWDQYLIETLSLAGSTKLKQIVKAILEIKINKL